MNRRISREECEQLYIENNTPAHVIRHCKAVCMVALTIAEKMNEHGSCFDLALIEGAALAHDVARVDEDHGSVGVRILEEHGYHDEAEIVKVHMMYNLNEFENLNETDMVCLGDRLVKEDRYVGLDERIKYILDKAPQYIPGVREHILETREKTRVLLDRISEYIGQSIESLFEE